MRRDLTTRSIILEMREEVDTDLQWRSWRRSSHRSQILSATVPQGASGRLNSECFRHVQHTHRRKTAASMP